MALSICVEKLYHEICQYTSSKEFYVAYSGGVDSHVLLHLMCQIQLQHPDISVKAYHINHGLQDESAIWAKHCVMTCKNLGIPCKVVNVKVRLGKQLSLEDQARRARYVVWNRILPAKAVLLTAHNKNDQVETVLLQLLRGAGPIGLASMPQIKDFGRGHHMRPLIGIAREDILAYAKQHHLHWVEDKSNFGIRFARNYLRHEVIPQITQRWPSALKTISRSASHCAETRHLLDDLAKQDLLAIRKGTNSLLISKLKELSYSRQRNVLRFWFLENDVSLPNTKRLMEIQRAILQSRPDAQPVVHWNGFEVRRFQSCIFVMRQLPEFDPNWAKNWDYRHAIVLPENLGYLQAVQTRHQGIRKPDNTTIVSIRFRTGGELFQAYERLRRPLKKYLNEWGVPPWERSRIPLVYYNDELVAVIGYATAKRFQTEKGELGYIFQHRHELHVHQN